VPTDIEEKPCRERRAKMNEIYISTDVETDGPIPGSHSWFDQLPHSHVALKNRTQY
jgi:hypothetical protein